MTLLRRALLPLATLLSAFLLFLVEPLMAKQILPWFGGAPAVWTTCLVFFQIALIAGYAYPHLTRRLGPRRQALVHLCLLVVSLATLPIVLSSSWKPATDRSPAAHITLMLTAAVGLPFVLLSASAPLFQGWFVCANPGKPPYWLYVVSNAGSLIALLAYPLVLERVMSVQSQAWLWSVFYGVFLVIVATSAYTFRDAMNAESRPTKDDRVEPQVPPVLDRILWTLLSACGSALLLATTNQLCQDVAVVPLLWVVPLALYLVTFMLGFSGWYRRGPWVIAYFVSMVGAGYALAETGKIPLVWSGAGLLVAMTAGCVVCHGELANKRPEAGYLTWFYLALSIGGAVGGLLVTLVAPMMFTTYAELPLALILVALLVLASWASERPAIPALLVLAPVLVVLLAATSALRNLNGGPGIKIAVRDFYGILRVVDAPSTSSPPGMMRGLYNGRVLHGTEFTDAARSLVPTMYYGAGSGIDVAIEAMRAAHPAGLRVGVVGLGAGTIAVWGAPGDSFRFFELNPNVVALATTYFQFIPKSKAAIDIVTSDGRLALEREVASNEGRARYDLLVVDAFSGDSVPAHLLTRECLAIYRSALDANGVLAMHISNRFLDLAPVVLGLARAAHWDAFTVHRAGDVAHGVSESDWMLVTSHESSAFRADARAHRVPDDAPTVLWTDAYSSLVGVLR